MNAEILLMNSRLRKPSRRETIRPALLEGTQETSYPPIFESIVACEFHGKEKYFSELFLLVMSIHKIPFDHPRVEEFIDKMAPPATIYHRHSRNQVRKGPIEPKQRCRNRKIDRAAI